MQTLDFNNPNIYVDWIEEVTDALYNPNIRYIFLKGWAGAGKSHVIAQLILQNIIDKKRIGVVRKLYSTIKASCFQLLCDYRNRRDLWSYIDERSSFGELQAGLWLCKMFGMDDEEKIKSLADYDWFWIEEANELTYDDFTQLDLRLRGKINHKIICTFNPVSAQSRLKTMVKDSVEYQHNSVWIEKTAWDNKFIDEHYLRTLESLKEKNPSKYKIYALNQWGEWLKGLVYPDYEVFSHDIEPQVIGLDFGYNHPTSLVYVTRVDDAVKPSLYMQEIIYKRELTAPLLIAEMEREKVPKDVIIVADNSRPEMIQQLVNAGYNCIPCTKGIGSVKDGIDKVLGHKLYVNGSNGIKELQQYVWRLNKSGEPLDEPIKQSDDFCDSIRYAVNHLVWGETIHFFMG